MDWSTNILRSARYNTFFFKPLLSKRHTIWNAVYVLPVPVAMTRSTRFCPLAMAPTSLVYCVALIISWRKYILTSAERLLNDGQSCLLSPFPSLASLLYLSMISSSFVGNSSIAKCVPLPVKSHVRQNLHHLNCMQTSHQAFGHMSWLVAIHEKQNDWHPLPLVIARCCLVCIKHIIGKLRFLSMQ